MVALLAFADANSPDADPEWKYDKAFYYWQGDMKFIKAHLRINSILNINRMV